MVYFIALCGIPGSGKSTISKQLMNDYDAIIHSFDELKLIRRKDLFPYLEQSLRDGCNVIADAPHIDKKQELNFLSQLSMLIVNVLLFL